MLVERVVGRRSDPLTGAIYHMTFKPPPEEVVARLIQRSDDTEEKCLTRLKTYHSNVANVLDYYKSLVVEVSSGLRGRVLVACRPSNMRLLNINHPCCAGGRHTQHGRSICRHRCGAESGQ